MPSAMSLHFQTDHPFVVVPLEGETIDDLGLRIDQILQKPYDMIGFDAGSFNGTINLSQLWNALLFIARDAEQPSILFSCDRAKLPDGFQGDYTNILRFAIRSALTDAVKIDGDIDEDDIADIAAQANDLGSVPIIVVKLAKVTTKNDALAKLEAVWDLEATHFELTAPVTSKEEIQVLEDAAAAFKGKHTDAQVIVHPVGEAAKKELLAGNTFGAPLLYTTDQAETETLPSSTDVIKMLKEKGCHE